MYTIILQNVGSFNVGHHRTTMAYPLDGPWPAADGRTDGRNDYVALWTQLMTGFPKRFKIIFTHTYILLQ